MVCLTIEIYIWKALFRDKNGDERTKTVTFEWRDGQADGLLPRPIHVEGQSVEGAVYWRREKLQKCYFRRYMVGSQIVCFNPRLRFHRHKTVYRELEALRPSDRAKIRKSATTLCPPKHLPFPFFQLLCKNEPILMILVYYFLKKSDTIILRICPPQLSDVATLPK